VTCFCGCWRLPVQHPRTVFGIGLVAKPGCRKDITRMLNGQPQQPRSTSPTRCRKSVPPFAKALVLAIGPPLKSPAFSGPITGGVAAAKCPANSDSAPTVSILSRRGERLVSAAFGAASASHCRNCPAVAGRILCHPANDLYYAASLSSSCHQLARPASAHTPAFYFGDKIQQCFCGGLVKVFSLPQLPPSNFSRCGTTRDKAASIPAAFPP